MQQVIEQHHFPYTRRWVDVFAAAIADRVAKEDNPAIVLELARTDAAYAMLSVSPIEHWIQGIDLTDIAALARRESEHAAAALSSNLLAITSWATQLSDGLFEFVVVCDVTGKHEAVRMTGPKWHNRLADVLDQAGYKCKNGACKIAVGGPGEVDFVNATMLHIPLDRALVGHCAFLRWPQRALPRNINVMPSSSYLTIFVECSGHAASAPAASDAEARGAKRSKSSAPVAKKRA